MGLFISCVITVLINLRNLCSKVCQVDRNFCGTGEYASKKFYNCSSYKLMEFMLKSFPSGPKFSGTGKYASKESYNCSSYKPMEFMLKSLSSGPKFSGTGKFVSKNSLSFSRNI